MRSPPVAAPPRVEGADRLDRVPGQPQPPGSGGLTCGSPRLGRHVEPTAGRTQRRASRPRRSRNIHRGVCATRGPLRRRPLKEIADSRPSRCASRGAATYWPGGALRTTRWMGRRGAVLVARPLPTARTALVLPRRPRPRRTAVCRSRSVQWARTWRKPLRPEVEGRSRSAAAATYSSSSRAAVRRAGARRTRGSRARAGSSTASLSRGVVHPYPPPRWRPQQRASGLSTLREATSRRPRRPSAAVSGASPRATSVVTSESSRTGRRHRMSSCRVAPAQDGDAVRGRAPGRLGAAAQQFGHLGVRQPAEVVVGHRQALLRRQVVQRREQAAIGGGQVIGARPVRQGGGGDGAPGDAPRTGRWPCGADGDQPRLHVSARRQVGIGPHAARNVSDQRPSRPPTSTRGTRSTPALLGHDASKGGRLTSGRRLGRPGRESHPPTRYALTSVGAEQPRGCRAGGGPAVRAVHLPRAPNCARAPSAPRQVRASRTSLGWAGSCVGR